MTGQSETLFSLGTSPSPIPATATPELTRRWRLVLAYDGTHFHGFSAQPGIRTVGGTLAQALAMVARLDAEPVLRCAGRTDAGVHAEAQVVHVDLAETAWPLPGDTLVRALNRLIQPEIVVASAEVVDAAFDARHSARARRYRYLVWNGDFMAPFLITRAWHVRDHLDLRSMAAAADTVVGEHDFRSFCHRPPDLSAADPITRRVRSTNWSVVDSAPLVHAEGILYCFEIEADAFCRQMVRSVVAHLVEVGRGRATPADIAAKLRQPDRRGYPPPAPAQGLSLVAVTY